MVSPSGASQPCRCNPLGLDSDAAVVRDDTLLGQHGGEDTRDGSNSAGGEQFEKAFVTTAICFEPIDDLVV